MDETAARIVSIGQTELLLEGDFDASDQLNYRPGHEILIVRKVDIADLEYECSVLDGEIDEARAAAERAESRQADVEKLLDTARKDLQDEEDSHRDTTRQLHEATQEILTLRARAS
ncbi:hypothetical protein C1M55_28300 [Rhodococcus qingshengii]|uniref:hypothetical protein n=1 Tax=Rhodococcus qingshengii TaxID=334542 RepID=UPI000C9F4F7A|nr:hypothetical protein [Rhodococcus qingshengii]AUS34633.1 hypothetical protein C1M55_28300 [Rhodococcus qingshengii]